MSDGGGIQRIEIIDRKSREEELEGSRSAVVEV